MNRKVVFAGVALLLVGLACTCGGLVPELPGTDGGVLPPPPDGGGEQPPPVSGGACDPLSTAIQPGTGYSGSIAATDQEYPANCTYYCLWIPGGSSELDISLSDFDVDLDLFVGYGDITSVRGADPDATPWLSNEFGTDDEFISIPSPAADSAYYIEVCSYEGLASNFTLQATTN